MGTRAWIATLFIPLILCAACGKADDSDTVAASIHQVLAGKAPTNVSADAWRDTHEFYTRRQHAPAWMMEDQRMRADAAVVVLGRAPEHGLDPADYDEPEMSRLRSLPLSEDAPEKGTEERARALAEADVRITSSLLTLGRDVAIGRTKPEQIDSRWRTQRKTPDLVGTLTAAADNGLNTWLDTLLAGPRFLVTSESVDGHSDRVDDPARTP